MRKVSVVVASVIALLCLTAVALAQTNVYGVSGSIASGGSKKSPKPVAIKFNYTVKEASGNLASPVKTYKIHFDGVNGNAAYAKKKCAASTLNNMSTPDPSSCPAGSLVGSGTVNALVGVAGQPVTADTAKCKLALTIYGGTSKSLTLFLKGVQPTCIANINQAIDAKLTNTSKGGDLTFTVPPVLLHPVANLDVSVTDVTSSIKKIGSGKKGLFTSIGCSGKRGIEVTFTAETGQTGKADSTAGKC